MGGAVDPDADGMVTRSHKIVNVGITCKRYSTGNGLVNKKETAKQEEKMTVVTSELAGSSGTGCVGQDRAPVRHKRQLLHRFKLVSTAAAGKLDAVSRGVTFD